MHSLDPNRTIPQSARPALAARRRSSALPSPALLLEARSRRPESLPLRLGEEVRLCAEGRARGAQECAWCGHRDSLLKNQASILNSLVWIN